MQPVTARAPGRVNVWIPAPGADLPGTLTLPRDPAGVVLFAHGSGSSRLSHRNQEVADVLLHAGIGTLLFDLLTGPEGRDRRRVFDIRMLAARLEAARAWVEAGAGLDRPVLGYFGAGTGAAAALIAEAEQTGSVAAIVSRGGRPDLAGEALPRVTAPTLLMVGGEDREVLELNQRALALLTAPKRLVVIPGATHLFEEPGTLEQAAALARDWFFARRPALTTAVGRTSGSA